MGSNFFRRRSPLPMGWEYELPEGKVATPAQAAEYRRRKRRIAIWYSLIFLGLAPVAIWIGLFFIPYPLLQFLYFIAASVAGVLLSGWVDNGFRCPVCETMLESHGRIRLADLSPERRAAIYGRYCWCDSCGTRFERYPNAIFPPEGSSPNHEDAPDESQD